MLSDPSLPQAVLSPDTLSFLSYSLSISDPSSSCTALLFLFAVKAMTNKRTTMYYVLYIMYFVVLTGCSISTTSTLALENVLTILNDMTNYHLAVFIVEESRHVCKNTSLRCSTTTLLLG